MKIDLSNRKVWQHAAGDGNANFTDVYLRWGIITNGPGYTGKWSDEAIEKLQNDGWTGRKITILRRFCEEMEEGDIVAVRIGTSEVYAVGEIVGPYMWSRELGDLDGWSQEHVRRVRWLWDYKTDNGNEPKRFDTYTLKLGDTTQVLDSADVLQWISSLEIAAERAKRDLPKAAWLDEDSALMEEPDFEEVRSLVGRKLFQAGVSSSAINSLLEQLDELRRIAQWYFGVGAGSADTPPPPSEHETVAYLVVPFLRAIGWTPQKMAVEWGGKSGRADIALFRTLPRQKENVEAIVEVKKMDQPCLTALDQAATYAKDYENCRRVILTDGLRYAVYKKHSDGRFGQVGYLNLRMPRLHYPVFSHGKEDEENGIVKAVYAMTPEWGA